MRWALNANTSIFKRDEEKKKKRKEVRDVQIYRDRGSLERPEPHAEEYGQEGTIYFLELLEGARLANTLIWGFGL